MDFLAGYRFLLFLYNRYIFNKRDKDNKQKYRNRKGEVSLISLICFAIYSTAHKKAAFFS
jgi:hypothetical protein